MAKSKPLRERMTRTYVDGAWYDGSLPVLAPDSQAMGSHIPDLASIADGSTARQKP